MKDSEITVISVGPGAYDLITLRALNSINQQDIIIGQAEILELFAKGRKTYCPEKLVSGTIDFINTCTYKKIGVLVSGDAGFFSLAKSITEKYEDVTVIPGVSSVNAGFAILKKQWGGYRFKSVHGRDIFDEELHGSYAILCDAENTPDRVIEKHPYVRERYNVYILQDLGMGTEAVYTSPHKAYGTSRLILVLEEK